MHVFLTYTMYSQTGKYSCITSALLDATVRHPATRPIHFSLCCEPCLSMFLTLSGLSDNKGWDLPGYSQNCWLWMFTDTFWSVCISDTLDSTLDFIFVFESSHLVQGYLWCSKHTYGSLSSIKGGTCTCMYIAREQYCWQTVPVSCDWWAFCVYLLRRFSSSF